MRLLVLLLVLLLMLRLESLLLHPPEASPFLAVFLLLVLLLLLLLLLSRRRADMSRPGTRKGKNDIRWHLRFAAREVAAVARVALPHLLLLHMQPHLLRLHLLLLLLLLHVLDELHQPSSRKEMKQHGLADPAVYEVVAFCSLGAVFLCCRKDLVAARSGHAW